MWCLKDILIKLTGGSANNQSFIRKEIQMKVIEENIWVMLNVTKKPNKTNSQPTHQKNKTRNFIYMFIMYT